MNMILAQIKKDYRSLRYQLIPWAICTSFFVILLSLTVFLKFMMMSFETDRSSIMVIKFLGIMIGWLTLGVSSFIAMIIFNAIILPITIIILIHEDPLRGDIYFWRTRPIIRWKLLAGKALFILLLSLPFFLSTIYITSGSVAANSPAAWIDSILFIVWIMTVAVLSLSIMECIGISLGLYIGVNIITPVVHAIAVSLAFLDVFKILLGLKNAFGSVADILHITAGDLINVFLIGGLAFVIIHQYLTLKTKSSFCYLTAFYVACGIFKAFYLPS